MADIVSDGVDIRRFWSVEYTDLDGDLITTNLLATAAEIKVLMDGFASKNIRASANDLSPPTVIS